MTEEATFTYSPLRKAFEKQTKTIKDEREKQVDVLEALKPKELKPNEIRPVEYDNYFSNRLTEIQLNQLILII